MAFLGNTRLVANGVRLLSPPDDYALPRPQHLLLRSPSSNEFTHNLNDIVCYVNGLKNAYLHGLRLSQLELIDIFELLDYYEMTGHHATTINKLITIINFLLDNAPLYEDVPNNDLAPGVSSTLTLRCLITFALPILDEQVGLIINVNMEVMDRIQACYDVDSVISNLKDIAMCGINRYYPPCTYKTICQILAYHKQISMMYLSMLMGKTIKPANMTATKPICNFNECPVCYEELNVHNSNKENDAPSTNFDCNEKNDVLFTYTIDSESIKGKSEESVMSTEYDGTSNEAIACKDQYDSRAPVVFESCGHVICKRCLFSLYNYSMSTCITCPLCRTCVTGVAYVGKEELSQKL